MKIRVQHTDGRIEILELHGTWTCKEGEFLNRLSNGNGFEHFFTLDGYYDGWGGPVNPTDSKTAQQLVDTTEGKRRFG
jgi:hypothetical protein